MSCCKLIRSYKTQLSMGSCVWDFIISFLHILLNLQFCIQSLFHAAFSLCYKSSSSSKSQLFFPL